MSGGTIVILARPNDPAAAMMAERWATENVAVITPWDLSSAGWVYRSSEPGEPGERGASVAISSGRRLPAAEIGGVITRLPCVFEEDLGHMEPTDRGYAASEMTAFLLAWLCGLNCPVVNRPTPTLLWGPSWRHEKWVRVADSLGIPVEIARRRVGGVEEGAKSPVEGSVTVTVVGRRCMGDVDPAVARHAKRLADAAAVDLLSVRFTGPDKGARFLGASIWPETVTGEVADAIFEIIP